MSTPPPVAPTPAAQAPGPTARRLRRRLAVLVLVLLVTLVHWLAGQWWVDQGLGQGLGDSAPPAINVAFVKELAVSAPPVLRRAPAPPPAAAQAPGGAASAPEPAASTPEPNEPLTVSTKEPEPEPEPPVPAASGALAAADPLAPSAPTPEVIDWPPSTQLSYLMTGQYRGPIQGDAQVSWLRDGDHYQVRLEVHVPPLFTRRMLSDGTLGPNGLQPQRYDQETQVALQSTRRETVHFEADKILLPNGKSSERPAGVQDTASQFVQMTWMFLHQPERLQVGRTVEFPLALPRRVGRWVYRVAERGPVPLPFGEVDAFHLVPERLQQRPNELVVETWVAPGLMYLPVRIVIRQDAENYLDLQLKSRPKVAGPQPDPMP